MRSGNRLATKLSYSDSHMKTTLAQADSRDTDKVGGGQPQIRNFKSLYLILDRLEIDWRFRAWWMCFIDHFNVLYF